VVAACLIDGELGPRQLTEKRMSDPGILELCAKVKVSMDNDLQAVYPQYTSSRVEVVLKSGERRIRQVDIPRGDPRDPLDLSGLSEKLRFFAGDRDPAKLEKVIDLIMRLDELESINELSGLI
jgi:2-methylcitrate dehydratase PrpD